MYRVRWRDHAVAEGALVADHKVVSAQIEPLKRHWIQGQKGLVVRLD
jgi:hypothetical protein